MYMYVVASGQEEMFFGVEIEDVMFADATNSTEPSPNDADILEKSYRYKVGPTCTFRSTM